jgi:hypothetical protein
MLRYRLRTLLIVLALGPPMVAWGWREYTARQRKAALEEYVLEARERALAWDEVDHHNIFRTGRP